MLVSPSVPTSVNLYARGVPRMEAAVDLSLEMTSWTSLVAWRCYKLEKKVFFVAILEVATSYAVEFTSSHGVISFTSDMSFTDLSTLYAAICLVNSSLFRKRSCRFRLFG
ncbi:hypothetical protein AB6A40_008488 [Gnathostoma spinigerum]|uniref:Uncharacterized protein n=1 Tax=Gnathostoma spinigerum TaxID=75299 RepID=A0ABD6EP73_9BILA